MSSRPRERTVTDAIDCITSAAARLRAAADDPGRREDSLRADMRAAVLELEKIVAWQDPPYYAFVRLLAQLPRPSLRIVMKMPEDALFGCIVLLTLHTAGYALWTEAQFIVPDTGDGDKFREDTMAWMAAELGMPGNEVLRIRQHVRTENAERRRQDKERRRP